MKINYNKLYEAFKNGGKLPRKLKKSVLGYRQSKSVIKKRIKQWMIDGEPYNTFCPECGCGAERMVDHDVEYPEIWIEWYCRRCSTKTSWQDNSPLYHLLDIIKENK